MKKPLILILFFLKLSFIFAQNQQITNIWGNPFKDERVSDIFEVNCNSFFVSIHRDFNGGYFFSESIILKLDSNCNVIDSLNLIKYKKRGKYYSLSKFFKYNNRIKAIGYAIDSLTHKHNIWVSEFDEDLSIVSDTLLGNADSLENLYSVNLLVTSQNNILLTQMFVPSLHDTVNTVMCLLDSNLVKIKENSFTIHFTFDGVSVVEIKNNQTFHIIYEKGISRIRQNDLSIDTLIWKPFDLIFGGYGAKTINDSLYFHPTSHSFSINSLGSSCIDTYLFIRNDNGIAIDTFHIGNLQKNFDKTTIDNIDFITLDSVFYTGTNYSIDSALYSKEDNSIFLWNISINGNINWQKYFYAPDMKLIACDITKTSDGGCFLTGVAWNWQLSNIDTTDIFFLKIDRNGIISGTQGINEIITQSEIRVYPNPAKDYLNFDMGLYKDFQLSVYNQLGQLILQKVFTSGNNSINIHDFKHGIYFYKLQNKNGKIINGKFVKE